MKKRILSIVLVWCCMSGLAHGQNTANDLLAICETFERTAQISGTDVAVPNIDAGRCFAYFTAVHQIVYLHLNGSDSGTFPFICPPNGTTATQFIRIFLAHARANPQDLHQATMFPVLTALMRAFPCK